MDRIFCRVAAFLLPLAVVSQASAQQPTPAWTLPVPGPAPQTAVWASNAACVAVPTAEAVHVVSRAGELLWRWDLTPTLRQWLISDRLEFRPLAVSPSCDAVALAGHTGYRYVWIASRTGAARFVKTTGTPMALAFDLTGEHIAITTGANRGYLLSTSLRLEWTGRLVNLPVRWPELSPEVSWPAANVTFTRSAVDRLLGIPPWGLRISDDLSLDGRWRVLVSPPWDHPERWMVLSFFGPEAGAYRARYAPRGSAIAPSWSKPMGCVTADITPDGEFVIATGDPSHPERNFWGLLEEFCAPNQRITIVLDSRGVVVASQPTTPSGEPDHAALTELVRRKTGRTLPPVESGAWSDLCVEPDRRLCGASPDGQLVLTSRGSELVVYRSSDAER